MPRTSTLARNEQLKALRSYLDGPTGNATLDLHEGVPPTTLGSPPGGTLLGTLTLGRPSFLDPSGGSAVANPITSDSAANASGTLGCYVLRNSSGVVVQDGTITAIGGGGDMEADVLTVVQNDPLSCSLLTLVLPESP